MSGVKKATVSNNLSRAMQVVRAAAKQCKNMADAVGEVGQQELRDRKKNAKTVHENVVRELPKDIAPFVKGETAYWEKLLNNHDKAYSSAESASRAAESNDSAYRDDYAANERQLEKIERKIEGIRQQIRDRDWYLDAENASALLLKLEAEKILENMRGGVSVARKSQQMRREAFSKLSESENLAQAAQREYDRLVNLARDRQEKQRIAEENQRNAMILDADIKSLKNAIESKDFKKFGNGLYTDSVKREISAINDMIVGGDFAGAIPRAQNLKENLNRISSAIESNQQAWTAAKIAAEKALADASAELKNVNREELEKFSGFKKSELDALYSAVDGASRSIASESFENASKQIADSIARLREATEAAAKNKNLWEQRDEMSKLIMQALYDCNYDAPEYYNKDDEDELSDLCVVAAAPGGVGDMKLRIALDGSVNFEVANIPEGREQLCIDSIRKMQEKLAADDVRFDVTDWGRAENQNKVHLDVSPKVKQVQKTVQRQG